MKRKTAYKIAIKAMTALRVRRYAVGHNAYLQGVRDHWAKIGHEEYEKIQKAIKILENEMEHPQESLFNYSQRNEINNEAE